MEKSSGKPWAEWLQLHQKMSKNLKDKQTRITKKPVSKILITSKTDKKNAAILICL